MRRKRVTIVASLAAMCLFMLMGAAIRAASDDVRGMIISRTGQTLIVSGGGSRTTVVLTANTRVKDDRGLFGLDKEEMADTVLIPGLKVIVDGSSDGQGLFVAETITVDGDDLETSEMIQAGLHPTAQRSEEHTSELQSQSNLVCRLL